MGSDAPSARLPTVPSTVYACAPNMPTTGACVRIWLDGNTAHAYALDVPAMRRMHAHLRCRPYDAYAYHIPAIRCMRARMTYQPRHILFSVLGKRCDRHQNSAMILPKISLISEIAFMFLGLRSQLLATLLHKHGSVMMALCPVALLVSNIALSHLLA